MTAGLRTAARVDRCRQKTRDQRDELVVVFREVRGRIPGVLADVFGGSPMKRVGEKML